MMTMINVWPWKRIKDLEAQFAKDTEDLRQAKITIEATARKLNIERNHVDSLSRDNVSLQGSVAAGLRIVADRDQTIAELKAELATTLDALRIADERADKNAAACDAAHDKPKIVIAKVRPVNVGAIPKDTRRTKAKTPAEIEAAETRQAERDLAKAYQERDAGGKFKAKAS
jgi:chromosome segregation ATPase